MEMNANATNIAWFNDAESNELIEAYLLDSEQELKTNIWLTSNCENFQRIIFGILSNPEVDNTKKDLLERNLWAEEKQKLRDFFIWSDLDDDTLRKNIQSSENSALLEEVINEIIWDEEVPKDKKDKINKIYTEIQVEKIKPLFIREWWVNENLVENINKTFNFPYFAATIASISKDKGIGKGQKDEILSKVKEEYLSEFKKLYKEDELGEKKINKLFSSLLQSNIFIQVMKLLLNDEELKKKRISILESIDKNFRILPKIFQLLILSSYLETKESNSELLQKAIEIVLSKWDLQETVKNILLIKKILDDQKIKLLNTININHPEEIKKLITSNRDNKEITNLSYRFEWAEEFYREITEEKRTNMYQAIEENNYDTLKSYFSWEDLTSEEQQENILLLSRSSRYKEVIDKLLRDKEISNFDRGRIAYISWRDYKEAIKLFRKELEAPNIDYERKALIKLNIWLASVWTNWIIFNKDKKIKKASSFLTVWKESLEEAINLTNDNEIKAEINLALSSIRIVEWIETDTHLDIDQEKVSKAAKYLDTALDLTWDDATKVIILQEYSRLYQSCFIKSRSLINRHDEKDPNIEKSNRYFEDSKNKLLEALKLLENSNISSLNKSHLISTTNSRLWNMFIKIDNYQDALRYFGEALKNNVNGREEKYIFKSILVCLSYIEKGILYKLSNNFTMSLLKSFWSLTFLDKFIERRVDLKGSKERVINYLSSHKIDDDKSSSDIFKSTLLLLLWKL